MVSAFEQSLSNMTHRLQHLTSTAERKVNDMNPQFDTYFLIVLYGG